MSQRGGQERAIHLCPPLQWVVEVVLCSQSGDRSVEDFALAPTTIYRCEGWAARACGYAERTQCSSDGVMGHARMQGARGRRPCQ